MKTIILRFSDAEREGASFNTVDSHNSIISSDGGTWWGWWKKNHEALRFDLLEQVRGYAQAQGIKVGLVNRKGEEKLYVADCTDCVISSGNPIPSPEPLLTPKYYSDGVFPAWLKFTRIQSVTRQEFIERFGEVPSLDPTLYEVVPEKSGKRIIPSRAWDLQPIEGRGDAILHISDLHFGEGHGFAVAEADGRGLDVPLLCEKLVHAIRDKVKVPIGIVVASGDFVSKGDANSYPEASHFLNELLGQLKLDKSHCVIVPGNHDMWTINVDHPTRTYAHEGPYRMFLRNFQLQDVQDLERITRIRTPNGTDLVFVALNSARIRSDKLKEYGYVSRHRYDELLKYLRAALLADPSSKNALIFVVLHHHILPVTRIDAPDETGRPVSLTLDAGELIEELCKAGIGYVLHGHQHVPFIGMVSRLNVRGSDSGRWDSKNGNIFVLGCGSTGAKRQWLSDDIAKNTFSVYAPSPDGLNVTCYQYLPSEQPSVYWSGSVPMQNFYEIAAR